MAPAPIHLRPTAELAERVLLPGDPGRALLIAQSVLDAPRMFNHHRGLWGYTGTAPDGEPMTIQSTGMGGPSAAIVIEELIALGARSLVRVGTCGGLDLDLRLGELVVATSALAQDGTSRALGAAAEEHPDPGLTDALAAAGARPGRLVTTDLFYTRDPAHERELRDSWRAAGALGVEMETAVLFTLARVRGVRAASLLAVSDLLEGGEDRERVTDETLEGAAHRLGETAARALA
jgi:DeoD family purine-nucleoside phosphorylase